MKTATRKIILGAIMGSALLCSSGCRKESAQGLEAPKAAATAAVQDPKRIAQATLGPQAEVLAQGDLSHSGSEQLLVIDRLASASGPQAGIFITRAAVVQKDQEDKWSEVLRCDDHIKNPKGFLASPTTATRVTGWRLEYDAGGKQGLEMRFSPASASLQRSNSATSTAPQQTTVVRWNTKTKRYQSFDESHNRYLDEIANLEMPQSFLR